MSPNEETPESEAVTLGDVEVSEDTTDNPEIPVIDAVEQHTAVAAEDDDDAPVWAPVPDDVDPVDASEQRREVGHPGDDDYR